MKIGITGSNGYQNYRKVKDTIFMLKQKFKEDLIIVSSGTLNGADKYAKKYAMELGCKYVEFNPAHTPKNLYSALHENYYGKKYNVKYFFHRNQMMAKYIDYLIAFIPEGKKSSSSEHTIKESKKLNKKIVIISWLKIYKYIFIYVIQEISYGTKINIGKSWYRFLEWF